MSETLLQIPLQELQVDPNQPRRELESIHSDTEFRTLQGLAESITRIGILQPLRVRKLAQGSYQILSGHRRFEAAKLAQKEAVPCIVVECSDKPGDVRLAQITENVQRKAMTSSELAWSVEELVKAGLSQAEVAHKLGVSESQISVLARISRLSALVSQAFHSGQIKSPRAAYDLDRLAPELQRQVLGEGSPDKRSSIGQKDVQLIKDSWKFNSQRKSHPFVAPALPPKEFTALEEALKAEIDDNYDPQSDLDSFFGPDRPLDSVQELHQAAPAAPALVRLPRLKLSQARRLIQLICYAERRPEPKFSSPDRDPSADELTRWLSSALKALR